MSGWHHNGVFKEKPCAVCGASFMPKSGVNKFCSDRCRGKWKYITGENSTENQYRKISGNWHRYFQRLMSFKGRRESLTEDILIALLVSQNYRCALSGVEMTCTLQKGVRTWTNASIDRINAGGPYEPGNIQLTCHAINLFRRELPVGEFVEWCKLVSRNNGGV